MNDIYKHVPLFVLQAIETVMNNNPELADPTHAYGKCEQVSKDLKYEIQLNGFAQHIPTDQYRLEIVHDSIYNGFYGHFWILFNDIFIDLTARQFGKDEDYPKIWHVDEGTGRKEDISIAGQECPRTCSKVTYHIGGEGCLFESIKL